eukprot:4639683-Pleurochrysis_carterae.AAC.1
MRRLGLPVTIAAENIGTLALNVTALSGGNDRWCSAKQRAAVAQQRRTQCQRSAQAVSPGAHSARDEAGGGMFAPRTYSATLSVPCHGPIKSLLTCTTSFHIAPCLSLSKFRTLSL